MPSTPARKGEPSLRSSSRGRSPSRSKAKTVKGKSRSRSRSRGRSKSPGRMAKGKQSPTPSKAKQSPSPTRSRSKKAEKNVESTPKQSPSPTRSRSKKAEKNVESTPLRQSLRLNAAANDKPVELMELRNKDTMKPQSEKESKPVSRPVEWEFGGPLGTFLLLFLLPATVYGIYFACGKGGCSIRALPKISTRWQDYLDRDAAIIYFSWLVFQELMYMLPIGRVVEGHTLRNGKRLKYRCNGFIALVISLAGFGGAVYFRLPVTIVYDKFLQILTTAALFSVFLSVFLYIKARRAPKGALSPGGNTGNIIYDFFMGHELNPRFWSFDLKFFCELRPGLIGWVMLNLCCVAKACQEFGTPPPALLLVAAFQIIYVADSLWFEEAILTTMDIIHDGFGFMLVWGDLVWVPFLYSFQVRFLLEHPQQWQWYCLTGIVLLKLVGYMIFRGSNSQKNEFRRDPYSPTLAHLETIPTSTGKRLLVSGWWGLCRHPNYLGDLLMAIAWSLPCGFSHALPYFYPIFMAVLLIHRERRDAANCERKYGASWKRYCERVKYRIIPYVY